MKRSEFAAFMARAIEKGQVVQFDGTTYYTMDAYLDNYKTSASFFAYAYAEDRVDDCDNMVTFLIRWNFRDDWKEAECEWKESDCYPDDMPALLEDSSNACDWDIPAEVTEMP